MFSTCLSSAIFSYVPHMSVLFSAMFLTCLSSVFFLLCSLQASLAAVASMLIHADTLSFQHRQIRLLKSALHSLSFQHDFQLCFVHACHLLVMYIRAPNLCSVEACCLLFFIHVPYMLVICYFISMFLTS